jgi:hypothetical protein
MNGWLLKTRLNRAAISLPWQVKNVSDQRKFTANIGLDLNAMESYQE